MNYNQNWKKRPELPTFIPPVESNGAPKTLRATRRVDDVLYVAGDGPTPCDVMFITPAVQSHDVQETVEGVYGNSFKQPPAQLKSPGGQIFRRLVRGVGIEHFYVTSICKWLLPKARISKPKASDIAWGWAALQQEIAEVQPQIIVCLGKTVFDQFCEFKFKLSEIEGGWFRSHAHGCLLYPMDDMQSLVRFPEYVVKWDSDLREIKRMIDSLRGVLVPKVPLNYRTLSSAIELREFVDEMLEQKITRAAVDCEWGGLNHIDGSLRSMQLAWAPGQAVYIRFMDEATNYAFDCTYKEAGDILRPLLEHPDWRYYGHQLVADFCWIHHVLGLEVYRRGAFDTLYAQQVIDENEDGKLERMALKYTDLGRYDIDLLMWKKLNHLDEDEGYGRVPDSILIDYACRDVDAVIRMHPILCKALAMQGAGVVGYYYGLFLPFVTDVFTEFTLTGLPMDMNRLSLLREVFLLVRTRLEKRLQAAVAAESRVLLMRKMVTVAGASGLQAWKAGLAEFDAGNPHAAVELMKTAACPTNVGDVMPFLDHLVDAPNFNIRSQPQMRRWLYQVKGFTPLKSTNNKDRGMPSISWEKVLEFPADRQREFMPSTDKQTLTVLAEKDDLVDELLTLNMVGNLVKAFLRPADVDAQGDILREKGLHFWVASDQRVHCQYSTTETGRPRAWKPNVLNWPSYVLKNINRAVGALVKDEQALPELERPLTGMVTRLCGGVPTDWEKFLPSLRSCVSVTDLPPLPGSTGWCYVESDYQTAEVRGLAFISGDEELINLITKPDTQLGVLSGYSVDKDDGGWVRLAYGPKCGIPPEQQKPEFLMAQVRDGAVIKTWTEADLRRHPDGTLAHPRFDKHWALAEMTFKKPRETMLAKKERMAGKVGNFCLAEGSLVLTQRGPIPIESVLCCDLLWDGTRWVSHGGVIDKGTGTVHLYRGLWATDNHTVWLADGTRAMFGEARTKCLELARTAGEGGEAIRAGFEDISQHDQEAGRRLLLRHDGMRGLWGSTGEGSAQYGEGVLFEVSVSESAALQPSGGEVVGRQVRGNASAVRARHSCIFAQLQRARDQSVVQIASGFCGLGVEEVAGRGFQAQGLRSEEQQRELFEAQPQVGNAHGKSYESSGYSGGAHRTRQSVQGSSPGGDLHRADVSRVSARRLERGEASRASSYQPQGCRTKKARLYDILNAGPLHRFTCSGILVSNSTAYGASPASVERKIESDTGTKPEPGTGQALLDALAQQQPVAEAWLKSMEAVPSRGSYQVFSGRVRHFAVPDERVPYRERERILSGLAREARNFPIQNSVANVSARAAIRLLEHCRTHGLRARPMILLYDSIVTLCPVEERFVVAELHDRFMHRETFEVYHDRELHYPIDTEFNLAWSERPPKAVQAQLDDPHWPPSPAAA